MWWLWLVVGVFGLALIGALAGHVYVLRKAVPFLYRAFQEKPLFYIARGQPQPDAEEIDVPTSHGLTLKACYLKAKAPRRGVLLFGVEFGANRWSCTHYCDFLRVRGFDIFSCEMRGQGDSLAQPGYEPLQWVTDYEVEDMRAAVRYLKTRPDAHANGIGFFGISKGGGAGLFVAAEEPWIRCCVTDSAFATYSVLLPYMKRWVSVPISAPWLRNLIPHWYYVYIAGKCLRNLGVLRGCNFPYLEKVVRRLAPRPWLMIHGTADNYIKPEMAEAFFNHAKQPKDFWLVDKAKHNQALQTSGEEYRSRVATFFEQHLAPDTERSEGNGMTAPDRTSTSATSS